MILTGALAFPPAFVGAAKWPFLKVWQLIRFAYHHPVIFSLRWFALALIMLSFWFLFRGGWREDR